MTHVKSVWRLVGSHPLFADAVLALLLLGASWMSWKATTDLFRDPFEQAPSAWGVFVATSVMTLPLALRRRAPLAALLASTAGFVALGTLLAGGAAGLTAPIYAFAVYSAAAHGRPSGRRNWVCAIALLAVAAMTLQSLNVNGPAGLPVLFKVSVLLSSVAIVAAMWALGGALGSGRRRAVELQRRTVELELEREENARRAVFDERVRIARELHDVVAHHVSVMGVQAGAARVVLARDPVKATAGLASIEASSRQAVMELHRLLGFLRQAGDPDDLSPRPGVSQLDALALRMSASDLSVEVRVEGDVRPLPATVDVSVYRIVQEALTNTLKHSGASHADVCLHYSPGELEVEIVDDGRGNGDRMSPGGLGLIGMRERAVLHGGELTAGPSAAGGFVVRASLPIAAGAL